MRPRPRATASSGAAIRAAADAARLVRTNAGLRRTTLVWGLWVALEWAVIVVLSVSAYRRGGTEAVAVVAAVRTLPGALAAPFTAGLTDRIARRRALAGALLGWAGLTALMPVALLSGTLLPLYLVVGVASITSTVVRPAVNGLIPQVVSGPTELAGANSLYSLVEGGASLGGPLVTGLALTVASDRAVYLGAAGLFAVAAAVAAGITTDFQPARRRVGDARRRRLDPLLGLRTLTATAELRALFVVFVGQTLTRGLLNVFVVSMVIDLLHRNVTTTGALLAAVGAGGLVGAAVTLLGTRWRPARPFTLGMTMWGVPLVAIAIWPHPAVVWAGLGAIGLGNALADVFGLCLLQRLIPDHVLGRAFGTFWGTAAATQAVGALVAAPLISGLGLRGALGVVGAAMALVALTCAPLLLRTDEALAVDPQRLAELRRCAVLAPLNQVALEQLTRGATAMHAHGGDTIIEAGDDGDDFFVVVAGTLVAEVDGHEVRRMGGGDCFGEIAALRNRPRTATVTAAGECDLLRLDGSVFVLAVTGHRLAEREVLELTERRLAGGTATR